MSAQLLQATVHPVKAIEPESPNRDRSRKRETMNGYGLGKGNDFSVSGGKAPKDEWTEIIDRVEAAILMSVANKVLADAAARQEEVDEHRKQLKLVELRNFYRKDSLG
jgi:hypothetical protein